MRRHTWPCYSQTSEGFSLPSTMSMTTPSLRSGPYTLPSPGSASTGRLAAVSRHGGGPYSSSTFSSHLQHHYNFNPQTSQAGFSFQNSMLFPGSQSSGVLPPPLPPPTTSSMPLPDSPSQDSNEGLLPQSTVPRRQSVSSHGSPIPPSSPILEDEPSAEQYKICSSYRVGPPSIHPMGMNSAFNSFPSVPHQPTTVPMHQPTTLPMPGVGYPHNPGPSTGMCHTPAIYATQDTMYPNGTSPLSLPMWNYPTLPSMNLSGNTMTKLSLDTPRYKLTPERAVPLIKWFEDHKEHPYPTRHEKMLLCQSTQLTYTQVSTWFANARRRMKKANSEEEESRSNHSSSDECASQNSLDSPHRNS